MVKNEKFQTNLNNWNGKWEKKLFLFPFCIQNFWDGFCQLNAEISTDTKTNLLFCREHCCLIWQKMLKVSISFSHLPSDVKAQQCLEWEKKNFVISNFQLRQDRKNRWKSFQMKDMSFEAKKIKKLVKISSLNGTNL